MNFQHRCKSFVHYCKQKNVLASTICLSLMISSAEALSQPGTANNQIFNKDLPVSINALPTGNLRTTLENLPIPAQERALAWLRRFDFPSADAAFLRADPHGGIFYEDPAIDGVETIDGDGSTPALSELSLANTFTLHSKPGASRTVYLDMDGHTVIGSVWNNREGAVATFYMLPYDTDGDSSFFDSAELEDIAETWKRISEDFAPFDIDVTTEEPSSFGPNVGHILISPRADQYGNLIYPNSVGGVAYVGVWGQSNFNYYQPALVFPEGTGYSPQSMSEAASHELGHNLGLSHDGTSSVGYYQGHGSDYTSWAPIMGVGYYKNVTQWSKGEYTEANNQQDDLDIIRSKLLYRTDDHEDLNFANATALVKSDATTISATNPVTDPGNVNTYNKGIIEDRSDIDLFYIEVGTGDIDLTVTPPWIDHFWWESKRGMNLDVHVSLYDAAGGLIDQSDPTNDTFARVTASVSAGRYILAIKGGGVRALSDGYSDYGSIGQYFINGTVPEDLNYTDAPTAPTDVTARLNGETNILLSWTDLGDTAETNEAGYHVYRQKDGGGTAVLIANLARDSSSFADNNLTNGAYSYQLKVFNGAGTNTSNSTSYIDISAPIITHTSGETTYTGLIVSGSYLDTANDVSYEVLTEVHQGGRPNKRVSELEHIWTISNIEPGASVTLEIEAEAPANTEGDDFVFSYAVNGGTYTEFDPLMNNTGRQVMSAELPGGTYGTVTVRVMDTNQTVGSSNADTVTIHRIAVISAGDPAEQAPVVVITEPGNNYQVEQGTAIVFIATANDYEDGNISNNISWNSSLDSSIGNGNSITISTLTIGTHQISASVIDSANISSIDTVTVVITDPNTATTPVAPVLSVSSSGSSVTLAWVHDCLTCTYSIESGSSKVKGEITFTNQYNVGEVSTLNITESTGTYYYKVNANDGAGDSNIVSVRLK